MLHTDSATEKPARVCLFARDPVCFSIHYRTQETLRGWDLGVVRMSVLVSVWLGVGMVGSITVGDRQMGMEMSRQ